MIAINISKEFSREPGARSRDEGNHSGQEFREKFLEKHFKDPNDNFKIKIYLDGTEGYATSFLDEAFGGLARKFSGKRVLKRLEFVSNEEPLLIKEIKDYIKACNMENSITIKAQ
ncbi:MAG: STAS-like domain-containing protein [Candidatus Anammoxibacter sp.]